MAQHEHDQHSSMSTRTTWALIGFLAIAAFFLFTEHRAHLFGILPFLLLLGCPLMHLFHGHGHGKHGQAGPQPDAGATPPTPGPTATDAGNAP